MAPANASSQIGFDTGIAGGSSTSVSSKTVAAALGPTANYLLVGVLGDLTSDKITGVTYNGVSMTQLAKVYNNNWVYVYGLYGPAVSASHNIVVSASGTCSVIGVDAVSYTNMSAIQPNASTSISLQASKAVWTAFAPIIPGCWGVQFTFNTSGGTVIASVATGTSVAAVLRVNDSGVLSIADTNTVIPHLPIITLNPNTTQWQVQRIDLIARIEESQ